MAENGKVTRGSTQEKFKESFTKRTFVGDSTILWNSAPDNIKKAKKIGAVKKELKKVLCHTANQNETLAPESIKQGMTKVM